MADGEDPLVHVRVVPHERRLEVVVVAVAMHRLQRRHLEEEARQGVEQVVVEEEGTEVVTEDECVRDGLVLQLVVGQRQVLQVRHLTDVRRDAVQVVVL